MLYCEFGITFASEEFISCFFPFFLFHFCAHGRPGTLAKTLHDSYMILSIFAYNNNNNNHNNNKGGGGGGKKKEEKSNNDKFFCFF